MNRPKFDAKPPEVPVTETHENTAQEVIKITVDRARLVLFQHKDALEAKRAWVAPLGLVITIILVFITSNFKEFFGFKADTWAAVFLIGLALSFYWLVCAVCRAVRSAGIEDVINKLKKSN